MFDPGQDQNQSNADNSPSATPTVDQNQPDAGGPPATNGRNIPFTVYHPQTGEPIVTHIDDAMQGIANGQYTVPRDQSYNIQKDGQGFTIDGSDLMTALHNGYTFDTTHDKAIRDYKESHSGPLGQAETAMLSFGNQFLGGIPDVAARMGVNRWMPKDNPLPTLDEWNALQEVNPGANITGGIAGFGTGLLLSGPMKGLAKFSGIAGEAVENLASKALAKTIVARTGEIAGARTVAADIVSRIAGSATEGAVFMAPQAATEAALGDPAAGGESLAWGVGIGAGFGITGELGKQILNAGKKFISSNAIDTAGDFVREAGKKMANVGTGIDERAIDNYVANPTAVNNAPALEEVTEKVRAAMDDAIQNGKTGSADSFKILDNSGVRFSRDEIWKPYQQAIDNLSEVAQAKPSVKAALLDIEKTGRQMVDLADEQGGVLTGRQMKWHMQELDSMTNYSNPQSLVQKYGTDALVNNTIKGIRYDIDQTLKNAVPEYRDQMAKVADTIAAYKNLSSGIRTEKSLENTLKRVMNGKDRWASEALANFDAENQTNFSEDLKNAWTKAQFEKATTNGSRKTLGFGMQGAAMGYGIAGPVGGLIGGAAGAATGMAADRFGTGWVKSWLDGLFLAEKAVNNATSKLDSIPNVISRKLPAEPGTLSTGSLTQILGPKHKMSEEESFDKIQDHLNKFQTNPQYAQATVKKFANPIIQGGAPQIGMQFSMAMHRGHNYLYNALPKNVNIQSPFSPPIKAKPSGADMSSFLRKADIVNNPFNAVHYAVNGTLAPEHIDAIKTVYPNIYKYMQVHLQHMAATDPVAIPYVSRVNLSQLFSEPLDFSMHSHFMADLQNSFVFPNDGSQEKKEEIDIASGVQSVTDKFQMARTEKS